MKDGLKYEATGKPVYLLPYHCLGYRHIQPGGRSPSTTFALYGVSMATHRDRKEATEQRVATLG